MSNDLASVECFHLMILGQTLLIHMKIWNMKQFQSEACCCEGSRAGFSRKNETVDPQGEACCYEGSITGFSRK